MVAGERAGWGCWVRATAEVGRWGEVIREEVTEEGGSWVEARTEVGRVVVGSGVVGKLVGVRG